MLKAEGESWEATVPGASWNLEARAKRERVVEFLDRIGQLNPIRSVGGFDRGPEEYGLHEPDVIIIVAFGDKSKDPLTIKLVGADSGLAYGWNSSSPALVYEFTEDVLETLGPSATYFLDRKVLNFDEERVSKLQLVQPFGSSWVVEKQKEGFFFSLPGYLEGKPASDSELKLYIHSLALLQAGKLVLEPMVSNKRMPALTIKVWTKGSTEPEKVDFYTIQDEPGSYLGKSTWLTVPFTLDSESVGQLLRSAFDVQGRSVVKIDTGEVARFIVVHGDTNYAVERSQGGWRLLGSQNKLQGIDMFLWRFTELQFEALPLNTLPETAVRLMQCKLVSPDGETLTEITFYADPNLPQGQCWMKNGGNMYYPVSSRLLKDLQGMFPVVSESNGESAGDKS